MPTVFSHAAIPLALAAGLGRQAVGPRLLAAGVLASVLPDLDVLAFRLGIAYSHALGHRGFSHSLAFAALLALLAAMAAPWLRSRRGVAALFVGTAAASHALLDMLTDGGLGVALWWPWSDQRWFAPWRVIEVSPIGLRRLLGPRGLEVLLSELQWIWLPALGLAAGLAAARRCCGQRGRAPDTPPAG